MSRSSSTESRSVKSSKYSPMEREIRVLADELGKPNNRPPTREEMKEHGEFNPRQYETEYGSWAAGVQSAGLRPYLEERITDEELVDAVISLDESVDGIPSAMDMQRDGEYSRDIYTRRFGSWEQTLEDTGIVAEGEHSVRAGRPSLDDDELIADLQRVAEELGHSPSTTEFDEHGNKSSMAYYSRYNRWNDALRAAGLEPRKSGRDVRVTKDDLIADIRRVYTELGKIPTTTDAKDHSKHGIPTFYMRFGSWENVIEAANLN